MVTNVKPALKTRLIKENNNNIKCIKSGYFYFSFKTLPTLIYIKQNGNENIKISFNIRSYRTLHWYMNT